MPVAKFKSPKEFLRELYRLHGVGMSGSWYFRGQADASWRLVPSLYRHQLTDEPGFEKDLLYYMRDQLTRRSSLPERLLENDDYILALAQHYGSPTRMLDWTLSPFIAAYFAAAGSLRERRDAPLAVFAIASITAHATRSPQVSVVYPPSGSNENLAAQSGVLLKHDWSCRDYWADDYDHEVASPSQNVSAALFSRFIRLELPAEKAGSLLTLLGRMGIDAINLFPGMAGFAIDAADSTWRSGHSSSARGNDIDDDELETFDGMTS